MERESCSKKSNRAKEVDLTFYSPDLKLRTQLGSLFRSYIEAITMGEAQLAAAIRDEAKRLTHGS